jgi:hypothetical protein
MIGSVLRVVRKVLIQVESILKGDLRDARREVASSTTSRALAMLSLLKQLPTHM